MTSNEVMRRPAPDSRPFAEVIDELLGTRRERNRFSPNQLDTLAKNIKRQATEHIKQRSGDIQCSLVFDPERVRVLADRVYTAYNSADRQTVTKAGEVVQSLAAFCRAINTDPAGRDQSNLLAEPFLEKAVERDSFDKHDLHVLNYLLPFARSKTWPAELMEKMFVETWSNDSRFVAGRVLVSMFDDQVYLSRVHRRKQGSSSDSVQAKREEIVADILLEKVANTDHNISLKPISQFIFPALFDHQPDLVSILLDRTSQELFKPTILTPSAAIHMWIKVAATARTSSLIPIQDLEEKKLRMSMHHAIDDVRLACWTTLTASKAASDRVEIECLDRVKEWFESNMRVQNAE